MTTRAQIDAQVARYTGATRLDVPRRYRDPQNAHDFNISIAIILATEPRFADAGPVYDIGDNLIGWRGIQIKGQGTA